jgi:hypothetical protein
VGNGAKKQPSAWYCVSCSVQATLSPELPAQRCRNVTILPIEEYPLKMYVMICRGTESGKASTTKWTDTAQVSWRGMAMKAQAGLW